MSIGNADVDATAYKKNGIKREKELYFFIYLNGEKYFWVGGGDSGFLELLYLIVISLNNYKILIMGYGAWGMPSEYISLLFIYIFFT